MFNTLRLAPLAIGVRLTRLSNRTLGFYPTVRMLRWLTRAPSVIAPRGSVTELAAEIASVSGPPYHANCLEESLFLWFLMERRGLDGTLRIGVVFNDSELVGHAWVELGGAVINDDADIADHYAVFEEDPTGVAFP